MIWCDRSLSPRSYPRWADVSDQYLNSLFRGFAISKFRTRPFGLVHHNYNNATTIIDNLINHSINQPIGLQSSLVPTELGQLQQLPLKPPASRRRPCLRQHLARGVHGVNHGHVVEQARSSRLGAVVTAQKVREREDDKISIIVLHPSFCVFALSEQTKLTLFV